MHARAGGNTAVGVMSEAEGGDQGAQVSAWMGAVAEKGQDGETTHMGAAGAGRTAGGCCHHGG